MIAEFDNGRPPVTLAAFQESTKHHETPNSRSLLRH